MSLGRGRLRSHRQTNAKYRPLPELTRDIDGAATRLHDLSGDEKTETQPTIVLALNRAFEYLEDSRPVLGADPHSSIFHGYGDAVPLGAHGDVDGLAGTELRCI